MAADASPPNLDFAIIETRFLSNMWRKRVWETIPEGVLSVHFDNGIELTRPNNTEINVARWDIVDLNKHYSKKFSPLWKSIVPRNRSYIMTTNKVK